MATISTDRISTAHDGLRAFTRTLSIGMAAASVMLVSGCSAPRTWPSVSGSPGISADTPPLPQVVVSALKYAHQEIAKDTPLIYNLPAEINLGAWKTFERDLAPAKAMCPGDTHVWTVRQARIDGSKAQVDVEYPSRDGFYQTVTVHMQGATGGFDYKPAFLQYWKIPVKDPVCQQPLAVVERLCGAAAAEALRAQRVAALPPGAVLSTAPDGISGPGGMNPQPVAPANSVVPPKAVPVGATEEPSK